MKFLEKNILIVGSVWPEPNSSAAGSRMMQLIEILLASRCSITFASTSGTTDHMADLNKFNIKQYQIGINDSNFDSFLAELHPDIVIFDRFMIEEQFGWRVADTLPDTLRILNTEDLHCLRKTREYCFKKGREFTVSSLLSEDITKRELASIYRCDLSIIISEYEMSLLKNVFSIKDTLLLYLPLLYTPDTINQNKEISSYDKRKNFITIGNFRHSPNWESVLNLKKKIWPLISKELPDAELHVYGAYPPPKATQLTNPKERFYIKGWTNDAHKVMSEARVCLAPLQFGAGIKGKLLDAMRCGTPSVTTTIGAEAMYGKHPWNGFITDDPQDFAKKACILYTEEHLWQNAQKAGFEIIKDRFNRTKFEDGLITAIDNALLDLKENRTLNFIGSMLSYHSLRSTKFMSRWIELKNKQAED
ncbi:glycosyltransferase [Aquimarina sp. 2-A2]|uniref:glycosyltransferase n=1 Tax=Aquimarina sp. 2-A2 TaxID=3382644 RepID=UPI00387F177C